MAEPMRIYYPNLVKDEAIRDKIITELVPTIQQIRDNRQRMEMKWRRFYRIWNCELDSNSYTGHSKIVIAALRNAAETFVDNIVAELFPNDDWYMIRPVPDISTNLQSESLQSLFEYFYVRNFDLKSCMRKLLRQLVLYGTSPAKIMWKSEWQTIRFGNREKVPNFPNKFKLVPDEKEAPLFYGISVRPISLYNWYAYPETAGDLKEATLIFEDMEVSLNHVRARAKQWMNPDEEDLGHVYEVPDGIYENMYEKDSAIFQYRRDILQKMGISQDPSDRWNKLVADNRNLSEVHWKTDLDGTGVKPWLVSLINGFYPIRIQENPFYDKEPPYLAPRFVSNIDEFYGHGLFETTDRIQYMINDIVNQTLDSIRYELNPITVVDPGRVSYPQSIRYSPGQKWLAEPEGILPIKPASVAQVGFSAFQMLLGVVHDMSGASAALQGVPAVRGRGRAQNTASGMAQMLGQSSQKIMSTVYNVECEFNTPLLKKTYKLAEQFMDRELTLRVLGRDGAILTKKVDIVDLVGDYEFKWLASTSSRNKLVVGQQMVNFLNIASGLPPPVLQRLNWEYIVRRIWTEGLGQRDAEQVFNPQGPVFSVEPDIEYELVLANRNPLVSPADDHLAHLKAHMVDRKTLVALVMTKEEPEEKLVMFDQHINDTIKAITQAAAAQKQQEQMQAIQQMMMMQQMAQQQAKGKGGDSNSSGRRQRPQQQPDGFAPTGPAALAQQLQNGGIQ